MRILIIEDEWGAQVQLTKMLSEYDETIEIVQMITSVREAIALLETKIELDLIFMDIHLSDGISFEIFEQVKIEVPIIFITAYDQYAIKAFKHNSIDYILKPVIKEELFESLKKFNNVTNIGVTDHIITKIVKELGRNKTSYRKSFLIQSKDSLVPINVKDIMAIYVDLGSVKCYTKDHKKYTIPLTLDQIEKELDPNVFFRINRQFILHMNAIKQMNVYFNGKLKIKTYCNINEEIIVSKQKATKLKLWLNS
ncbi:LytTR family DNA-binding domain-containing protein [Halosquirtibacter laminarini]|uniref:LytTR family DNA-binding domain-containing protein n=1 Tax=Halosquirtibacter laminarini TaxID=3374600 RepID=A0AC61NP10_9BACT|nr:LytTR family DNA-binding domain-containing protein [Prolixibacteraceae bacterium]